MFARSAVAFLLCSSVTLAQEPSFARQVRPLLTKYCSECHNAKSMKGDLNLDSMKALLAGGENGPVVVVGKSAESRLVTRMDGREKPVMPPMKITIRPTKAEIDLIRAWVDAGAKDDGSVATVLPVIIPKNPLPAPITGLHLYDRGGPAQAIAQSRRIRLTRQDDVTTTDPVTAMSTSGEFRNGVLAAIAAGRPGSHGEVFLIHNDERRARRATLVPTPLRHSDMVIDLARSPKGDRLASAGYDSVVRLGEISVAVDGSGADGAVAISVRPGPVLKDHSDSVYGLAFSPDGDRLATCAADRTVKIWDTSSGKLEQTLAESTDWLLTVAWSPDGKRIAAAGVDKSIRLYDWDGDRAKISRSTFGHEGPVLKIAFSTDGKSLYSLGKDRVVKSWDVTTMDERRVFAKLPEDGLVLAVHPTRPQIGVGRFDGVVQIFDVESGDSKEIAAPPPMRKDPPKKEPKNEPKQSTQQDDPDFPAIEESGTARNDSPGRGQKVTSPVAIHGRLDRAGDVDYFQFEAAKGQSIGVEVVVPKGAKFDSHLQLTDVQGNILAESERGHLGHTFAAAGTYAVGVRDRELRGGKDFTYTLRLGEIPVVTSWFPLGGQRGTTVDVTLDGVFLSAPAMRVEIPKDIAIGSKVAVPVPLYKTPKRGQPLGSPVLVVGEFPDRLVKGSLPTPGSGHGRLAPGAADRWSFDAKKGETLIVEIDARRLGSSLDSIIEIQDASGQVVPRAVLRCQAKTNVTFRDHDSVQGNIRLEHWSELAVNDLLYVDGDLMKIKALPPHPDADCTFFSHKGARLAYLGTTPTHHAKDVPMYKVSVHPPGMTFPANGFPVFTIPYRNDDGGPGYGRDSRLLFQAPADGTYQVVVKDARGQGGADFGYRVTVRAPRPDFRVAFSPTAPTIARGSAVPVAITVDRIDDFDGPIHLEFDNLPSGLSAPKTVIGPGDTTAAIALFAEADAAAKTPLNIVAEALVGKSRLVQTFKGGVPVLEAPGDLRASTDGKGFDLKAGGEGKLLVHIERGPAFTGRVPLEVRGLPHGVRVLDVGLNGILVNESETQRTIAFAAEPWVVAGTYSIVVLAKREGKNTEHAAKAVTMTVR